MGKNLEQVLDGHDVYACVCYGDVQLSSYGLIYDDSTRLPYPIFLFQAIKDP